MDPKDSKDSMEVAQVPPVRRPIMAVGGGAFSLDAGLGPLEEYWLALARRVRGRGRPRVCYVGTASGDDATRLARFRAVFGDAAEVVDLALFERTVEDIEAFLLGLDAVFVGGGNTASLLAVWRAHGVDRAMRRAHGSGVVLAGRSAGSICWFDGGTTDSFGPSIEPLMGALGLIPGSHCPHYDGEPQRRPRYHDLVQRRVLPAGLAVDDHAAALFDGSELVRVVAAHPGPAAYRVEPGVDGAVETRLPVDVLAPAVES